MALSSAVVDVGGLGVALDPPELELVAGSTWWRSIPWGLRLGLVGGGGVWGLWG